MSRGNAYPGNAPVGSCKWYLSSGEGGPSVVEVHLWPVDPTPAWDSYNGRDWKVYKCLVCGGLNQSSLEEQAKFYGERG